MGRDLLVISLAAAAFVSVMRPAVAQPMATEQAVQNLQATLATIPHLNEADFLSDESGARFAAARNFIVERQCASRSANPLLAIAYPTGLSLRTGQEAGAPPGTAGGFELPLRVAVLSDVPNLYLRNMSALVESRGLPAEVGTKLRQEMPEGYRKLVSRTLRMIDDYDLARCARARQDSRHPRPPYVFIVPTY